MGLADISASDLINVFNGLIYEDEISFLEQVVSKMSSKKNVSAIVSDHLQSISKETFHNKCLRAYDLEIVPRHYLLHEDKDGWRIILNHYRESEFENALNSDKLRPHHHTCAFASIVLRGGFKHVSFVNEGSLKNVDIRLKNIETCQHNDIIVLRSNDFHSVHVPEDNTLTLMVRGPAVIGKRENHVETIPNFNIDESEKMLNELRSLL